MSRRIRAVKKIRKLLAKELRSNQGNQSELSFCEEAEEILSEVLEAIVIRKEELEEEEESPCEECLGIGDCLECEGEGRVDEEECCYCEGSGVCETCGGFG